MDSPSQTGSDPGTQPSLWARAAGSGGDPDADALRELAGEYWYCAYAWWRRAGLDPMSTATATLASFEVWLGESPPKPQDPGAARMRDWMEAQLRELAGRGVKLKGEPAFKIDGTRAEERYAGEPSGEPGAVFQRRWALTVIEAAATALRDEYSARGEGKLHSELMCFAGFAQADENRYSSVAQRLGQTAGAIRKAVFEFRQRQREILLRIVGETVLDPADAESEITALLCACDATGPETSSVPLPSVLQGQQPDEILARAMRSVKMTHAGSGGWQPPTIEEAGLLFPNYEIVAMIGRGGMGAVYKGRQVELDRPVAIKLLPLEVSVDPEFADRFRREARAMAKLNHPNIILIYEFGATIEGHLFFVMEYVEGADLHQIIHGPGVPPERSLSIIIGVCDALAYAHAKGVIHRDIKPANVMVSIHGEVKVADFGLARLLDPGADQIGHTMTGTVMGTPDYMAPEQTQGMNVDCRADIYSLGVMLYEMLCQQVPKGAFQPPSSRIGCDTRIDEIVIKAMQQAPEHRYQSTQEMKADVTSVRTPHPVGPNGSAPTLNPNPATPQKAPAQAQPPGARKRMVVMLVAGLTVVVIATIAGAMFLMKPHAANEKAQAVGGAVMPEATGGVSAAASDRFAPPEADAFVGTWSDPNGALFFEIKSDHTATRTRHGNERAQGQWVIMEDGSFSIRWDGAASYRAKLSADGKSMTSRKNLPMIRRDP